MLSFLHLRLNFPTRLISQLVLLSHHTPVHMFNIPVVPGGIQSFVCTSIKYSFRAGNLERKMIVGLIRYFVELLEVGLIYGSDLY